jgi:hypothetical protein
MAVAAAAVALRGLPALAGPAEVWAAARGVACGSVAAEAADAGQASAVAAAMATQVVRRMEASSRSARPVTSAG